MHRRLVIGWMTLALAACGGGGGGSSDNTPATPNIANVATVKYTASNAPDYSYDPWTDVYLMPTVTGLPLGVKAEFSAHLPTGLSLAPDGTISGLLMDPAGGVGSMTVMVTAAGYSGALQVDPGLHVNDLLINFVAGSGGFAAIGGQTFTGTVGVAGTITFPLTQTVYTAGGAIVGAPLPAGVTVTYGFGPHTNINTVGATIDPATGVVSWTPSAAGTYQVEVVADSTKGAVTRHTTSFVFTIVVS